MWQVKHPRRVDGKTVHWHNSYDVPWTDNNILLLGIAASFAPAPMHSLSVLAPVARASSRPRVQASVASSRSPCLPLSLVRASTRHLEPAPAPAPVRKLVPPQGAAA
jgi:hypothetical protein